MSQVSLSRVGVEFGATEILRDVTFTVARGDRWGIVGRNGSGKTTLINVIVGRLEPTSGVVARASGVRFTLLEQHREFPDDTSAWDAAASPFAELVALEHSLQEQAARIGELGERVTPELLARYDRDLERFAREDGYAIDARVDAVLHGLGFDPAEARTRRLSSMSGGEQGRIALARQLVAPADVLLLDEPTNHLDLDTTHWLEEYLATLDATVLVISHDRAFLEAVVNHVLHIENRTATSYEGSYSAFVEQRAMARLTQERAFVQQQKVISKEEDYIRRNIAGQNSKQAKGRRKRLERMPRLTAPTGEARAMSLRLEPHARGGDQVLIAKDVRVRAGERVLIDDFSGRIERGDVVGFVGPNGAGKSTLLRAIAGERDIDAGELRTSASTDLAYYRQDLAQVPLGKSLFDIIHDLRPMWDRGQVQGHLGRFGFSGDAVQRQADTLSGGERARVALAMLMLANANFLLLDEPTNHLDVESIEALEDALDAFEGTVLLVSHDRALLRGLALRVWSLEGTSIDEFDGSFVEWEQMRAERAAAEAQAAAAAASARRDAERRAARARESAPRAAPKVSQKQLRAALEDAEKAVADAEARLAQARAALEDPELYTNAEGARRAGQLKAELDAAERALEAALERWNAASEALD